MFSVIFWLGSLGPSLGLASNLAGNCLGLYYKAIVIRQYTAKRRQTITKHWHSTSRQSTGPHATRTAHLVKVGHAAFSISARTDRHRDKLVAMRRTPHMGEVMIERARECLNHEWLLKQRTVRQCVLQHTSAIFICDDGLLQRQVLYIVNEIRANTLWFITKRGSIFVIITLENLDGFK